MPRTGLLQISGKASLTRGSSAGESTRRTSPHPRRTATVHRSARDVHARVIRPRLRSLRRRRSCTSSPGRVSGAASCYSNPTRGLPRCPLRTLTRSLRPSRSSTPLAASSSDPTSESRIRRGWRRPTAAPLLRVHPAPLWRHGPRIVRADILPRTGSTIPKEGSREYSSCFHPPGRLEDGPQRQQ
jgi:hypothetical protein